MVRLSALIFTTNDGQQMKSSLDKALHKVCGKEMISHVISALYDAQITEVVINNKSSVSDFIDCKHSYTEIENSKCDSIIVLPCDAPLITAKTIEGLVCEHKKADNDITVLSTGERENEWSCIFCIKVNALNKTSLLKNWEGSMIEDILPEAVENIKSSNGKIGMFDVSDVDEIFRVNNRVQLAKAEKIMRRRINESFMCSGVTIIDPDNTYICANAKIGIDTVIYPGTVIEGNTVIGENVYIGPNCKLTDAVIGSGVDINISTIVSSSVGENTHVGPYAYIRPDCSIGKGCKVGDFVELKKAVIGDGTKLSHLTYVGDAEVGCGVNFGCGTVTVNYDGKKKYKTVIKDNAFIGCNTNLVSPVTVNEGAYIAAGSTITDDVPEKALAIARARQVNKENWEDRRKK